MNHGPHYHSPNVSCSPQPQYKISSYLESWLYKYSYYMVDPPENQNKFISELYHWCFNSLAPGRSECDSKNVIFNLVFLLIGIFRSSQDTALRWMPQDLTDDKSTLVQVMAWCCQATSHYLSQCWLSSLSPYGVARPQWVNSMRPDDTYMYQWTMSSLLRVMACHLSSTMTWTNDKAV